MASERRSRVRHSVVVNFDSQAAKAAFKRRVEHVRSLLSPTGQPTLDNNGLMSAMFDLVEQVMPAPLAGMSSTSTPTKQCFNKDNGKFVLIICCYCRCTFVLR